MDEVITIGRVKILDSEAYDIYSCNKYLVAGKNVYQIFPPHRAYPVCHGDKVYTHKKPLVKGKTAMSGAEINAIIGINLLL